MPLVTVSNVSMHYGGPDLLRGITLDVEPGQKIGLIGQNGTGKSTLLKLIAGKIEPVAGELHRQRNLNVAYQAQEFECTPGSTVVHELRKLFAVHDARQQRLHKLEEKLAAGVDVLADYERLQHEHESAGGYEVELRIEQVLTGLGLPRSAWSQPIETFSGGERNIIALARILLQAPDLMLLDEPSNHLDMEGIEWFIQFMRRTEAAVVMVSHNRHLLDATCTEIWELHGRKITRWAGNYSDFTRQKAEALALQERQYKAQQNLIKRIQFQARRLLDMARAYDDPGQAKRAKSMLMRIEQMDKIEAPDKGERRFHASLSDGRFKGHMALEVTGLNIEVGMPSPGSQTESPGSRVPSAVSTATTGPEAVDAVDTAHGTRNTEHAVPDTAHGTRNTEHAVPDTAHGTRNTEHAVPDTAHGTRDAARALLTDASLTIEFGQRVALVGPNGSGKTTLFRAILNYANWEAPDIDVYEGPFHIAGRIRTGKSAIIGDYSQIHGHALDESATLMQWFMDTTNLRHEEAAKLLHRFLFSRDDLERTIGTLSGGEKSRLQLARLVHEGANFLMLDEPTNHLDIQACEQLEEMLDEFEGTLLIISHDRYFLDKLVNRVIELKDCGLQPFAGTFAEWWQEKHQQAQQSRGTLQLHSQKTAAARRSESAQAREELKAHQREQHRMKNQLKQLEARIEKLETKQAELELSLAEAFSADGKVNAAEAQKLHTAFEAVKTEIAKLYGEWEALAAAVE